MKMNRAAQAGFSILEVILAAGLFAVFATGMVTLVILGFNGNRLGNEQTTANQYAVEGIEAMRSIKNQSFASLVNSTGTGIVKSGNVWTFSGTNNTFDKYTRTLAVADVQRDGSGNIVSSGGTVDTATKKVTSTVTWNAGPTRANSVVLNTYLTNWKAAIGKGGMLVYGNGGTTSDQMMYQLLDGSTGAWSTPSATADVDSATTNKAARAIRLYSSTTRNEKILLSRHWDGTAQTMYAQVWNGSTWGNVVQLTSFTNSTFLDVRNFDGTYLANGDFMAMYYDNTANPKFRVWNGTSWSSSVAAQSIGGSSNYIILRARPGTNEVMFAEFDQSNRASTEYFNGGTYTTANWSAATNHSTAASGNTKKAVDFAWDANNPLKGQLIYESNSGLSINDKIWTANGSGGGSWGSAATSTSLSAAGSLETTPRIGADEFLTCNQDVTPAINCYKTTTVPAWTSPTNGLIITLLTDNNVQRAFDVSYGLSTGTTGIVVYNDVTTTPKLKKYNAASATFDVGPTSLPTLGGNLKSVSIVPMPNSDDQMILMGDANTDLYSVVWDGTNNVVYTSPTGKAFTTHGLNGSAVTDYWYDFSWDNF